VNWLQHYDPFVPHTLPAPTHSLIDIFERTARLIPHRPAIHHFDRTITWAQLDDWAERFAARLDRWGIRPGDRVAVWMQNDPEFPVAVYGAWKRGCIVVPLSAMFKRQEMEYHVADSGARALVCIRALHQAHGPQVEHVQFTDTLLDDLAADTPAPHRRVPVAIDDTAYLVYTSGTTGSPKGAICPHRCIAYNTEVFRTWMRVTQDDRILGMAPLFHITGLVAQLALSTLSGAPLVLYHRFDPARTFEMVERWRPTLSLAAITAYLALLNDPAADRADLSSLTKVFSGGAPVAPAVTDRFQARFGSYIHNTYGLTESNSPSHITPLLQRGPVDPVFGALSIGLPIPGCEARIVDLEDGDREAPPGESGEQALRGPMIFPGYWNKPEATAQAFHNGWFLTGDIAVRDSEGWFYIVDRKKDMIVASGYKVWPREVEDVLYQHPAVREAAVVGVPDEYRGETVKAFVALREDWAGRVAGEDLVAHCRDRLAAYKYPRQVEFVPEIPKTATGKFLRRSLR
jgi:long-chain acyl-CoA synthetase